ncbi:hypothetical protein B9Z45_02170 [Limnohabitans sp. 2KL-17]|uniref:porin family protein n=1 Tax=Limnohabitans sp. 2KL-17 TaxID=1100704 RepID=UPI000D3D592B|nr:porin family protein [Limnohabitans sp. 2KL-17]PUE62892.1 hypothetical protein B9Z45_02170 [Limnohabitans sp. 2KL-17]
MMKKFCLALVGLVLSSLVHAQDQKSDWYVGAGVGQSNMTFDSQDFRVNPSIAAAGFNASTYETRDSTSFNLYGGYRFSQNWSVKAEYTDFGKQKWGYNITGGNANSDLNVKGYSLSAVGTFPVVEKVSFLVEAGAFVYDAKRSPTHSGTVVPLTGTPEISSKMGLSPYAAIGAQYELTTNVAVVGKYAYYGKVGSEEEFGRVNLNNFNISLQYSF